MSNPNTALSRFILGSETMQLHADLHIVPRKTAGSRVAKSMTLYSISKSLSVHIYVYVYVYVCI